MNEQKKCPTCGHLNSAADQLCFACMADISGVSPERKSGIQEPVREKKPTCPEHPALPPSMVESRAAPQVEADPGKTRRDDPGEEKILCRFEKVQFELGNGSILGRHSAGKEFLANVSSVSRQHARFTKTIGTWYVEDLGSTNGTYVNGELIIPPRKQSLKRGDTVSLSTRITIEIIAI